MVVTCYTGTLDEQGGQRMSEVTVTDDNFDAEVGRATTPVLVDFWAVWCGPCQMQDPIVAELSQEMGEKVKIGKLNVDENPRTAQKYMVMSIPTIMIFKGGTVVKQFIGVTSKQVLLGELNKLIN